MSEMIVADHGNELIDYLGTLVNVQTHQQEALDLRNKLTQTAKKERLIEAEPKKFKANINWKIIVAIIVGGDILAAATGRSIFIPLMVVAVVAYVVLSIRRAKTATALVKQDYNNRYNLKQEQQKYLERELSITNEWIQDCANTLNYLYQIGPLHKDYWNLSACATFYDWFSKGQTYSLVRNGADEGAYNMYEAKLRHGEIMSGIEDIKQGINAIRQSQERLYNAVMQINNTVNNISGQVQQVVRNTGITAAASVVSAHYARVSAYNSEVSAYYAQASAHNTESLNRKLGINK